VSTIALIVAAGRGARAQRAGRGPKQYAALAGRAVLRRAPPLLHERFIEAFQRLSPVRQSRILATLDEVAAMMGAAELDAAPLLDTRAPVERED